MTTLVQAIVSGLLLGGLYAIIGVGMSLIFGIMKLTNLAHGDIMIMSTFLTMVLVMQVVGNIILALLITIVIMMVFGFLIQQFLINNVIDKGPEPPLLVTFGLAIIIQNVLFLVFGPESRSIPTALIRTNVVHTKLVSISAQYVVNFVVAIAVIVVLTLVMNKTALGRGIRASSSDVMAAELMGVNTKRMYIYAMCLTMIVTAIAGLLVGSTFVFYPTSGTQYLITAFGVVVIGGMGSLMGTLLGGIILGLAQLVGASLLGSPYQLICGYIVLLVILAVRPQGLLSKAARK